MAELVELEESKKPKEMLQYENLSPEAKETALADVLLKSAISQALELHTEHNIWCLGFGGTPGEDRSSTQPTQAIQSKHAWQTEYGRRSQSELSDPYSILIRSICVYSCI